MELKLEIIGYLVRSSAAVGRDDFYQFLYETLLPLKAEGGADLMELVAEDCKYQRTYLSLIVCYRTSNIFLDARRNNFVLGLCYTALYFPSRAESIPGYIIPEWIVSLVLPVQMYNHSFLNPEAFFWSIKQAKILTPSKADASVPAKAHATSAAQNTYGQAPEWLHNFPNLRKLEISIYIEPLRSSIRNQWVVPVCLGRSVDVDRIATTIRECTPTFKLPDVRFKVLSEGCRTAHKAAPDHWRKLPYCELRNAMVALGPAPCGCEGKLREAFRATLLEKK